VKAVADGLGVAHSNLVEQIKQRSPRRLGRPPLPADDLVAEIKSVIADLPTYGYHRVHAILRRKALDEGRLPPNHKRVSHVGRVRLMTDRMKEHGLLLQRHAGGAERRHDGKIAVERSDLRWCSDAFAIGCENGERVRVAFALDCCDREAMSYVATTGGIGGEEVRDLMVGAVEHRFGRVNRLPQTLNG
jgi:putative transposase